MFESAGFIRHSLLLTAFIAVAPTVQAAQIQQGAPPTNLATRMELQRAASEAERVASSSPDQSLRTRKQLEAARLRTRLQAGDFRVGDRIYLRVYGDTTLDDTLTVQPGPSISVHALTTVPLAGVLRSELRDRLTEALGKYLRTPDVQVTSLMRVGITGEAGRPGYYTLPFESLLSDAIMAAGGPTATGDLHRISIRRGSATMLEGDDVQKAIAEGSTLDQLDLRPGDEIVIGQRHQTNWPMIMGWIGTAMGIATLSLMMRGNGR